MWELEDCSRLYESRIQSISHPRSFESSAAHKALKQPAPVFWWPPTLIYAAANYAKARQAENEGHCGDWEVPSSPSNNVIAVCSLALTRGPRGQAASPPANCTAPRRTLPGEGAAPQTDCQQAASYEHIAPKSGQWHNCWANKGGSQKKNSSNRETACCKQKFWEEASNLESAWTLSFLYVTGQEESLWIKVWIYARRIRSKTSIYQIPEEQLAQETGLPYSLCLEKVTVTK